VIAGLAVLVVAQAEPLVQQPEGPMGSSAEPHGVAGAAPFAAGGLLLAGDIGGTKTIRIEIAGFGAR
jgi:hypothetical protein